MASWQEEAREDIKQLKSGDKFTLSEGLNHFRVLPNVDPEKAPYIKFRLHRNVGPDNGYFRCGKKANGVDGNCWYCDKKLVELAKISAKKDIVYRTRSILQYLVQISNFSVDTQKFSKAKPWWVPSGKKGCAIPLLSRLSDVRKNYIDPVKGRNMSIERTGTGQRNTEYGGIDVDDDSTKVPDFVLKSMKPLWDFAPKYDEKMQIAVYKGQKRQDVVEDEEKPKARRLAEDEGENQEGEEGEESNSEENEEEGEASNGEEGEGEASEPEEGEEGSEEGEENKNEEEGNEEESNEDGEEPSDEAPPPSKKPAPKGGKKAPPPPPKKTGKSRK